MSNFAAFWLRAKNINRWPLQAAIKPTNVAEHSFECAIIGYLLGAIDLHVFDNKSVNPDKGSSLCIFH
jgi:5'-deoxynucleotidase YfbR-like HD superfamily hydrolase